MDNYAIAAFRSRQQVLRFEKQLQQNQIACQVIATPQRVAIGCGLSLRFDAADLPRAMQLCTNRENLIGFYLMQNGRLRRMGS